MNKRISPGSGAAIVVLLLIISKMTALTGCAVQSPPLGGPRDSLPPVLVSAKPADSSRNIIPKKIVLEFNEFVKLETQGDPILVSPVPRISPTIEAHLKTVTISIKDTLDANTTYSFDFGRALSDINESNIAKNIRYTFSTGPAIDSLELSGQIIAARTGKVDSTLTVALYRSQDDSAVTKEKPRYIARTQGSQGRFTFHNLPRGTYALYAFSDEGGNKRYLSKSQIFAFADQPITLPDTGQAITLYAYAEEEAKPPLAATGSTKGKGTVQQKVLRIETSVAGGEVDLLGNLDINFKSAPLRTLDTTKIFFSDSSKQPITSYHVIRDTANTKISIVYPWLPEMRYTVILSKDFATDTVGRTLAKNDTLQFRGKRETDYGLVRLRFLNIDLTKNPVLEFVHAGDVAYSYVLTSKEFNARLFTPGEYDLRIVYDANRNGKWDPGEFFGKHRQPERVQPVSRPFTVKANWDNEVDITL